MNLFRVSVLGAAVCVAGWACVAYTTLSLKDQEALGAARKGKAFYLKQSFFVGPFFTYDDRLYLSERAFDERVLLQDLKGKPILPAEATGVIPMGSQLIIQAVEFPNSSAVASRNLRSPRSFTWVVLKRAGEPESKPLILVLTPEFHSIDQVEKSLAEYLVSNDPRTEFQNRPTELQAIDRKAVLKGMGADALLRSRGYPDHIQREFVNGVKIERWRYAPQREVTLREDQVESAEGLPLENPPAS